MGLGVLVELEFDDYDTSLEIPGSDIHNLNVGVVRAVSPELPQEAQDRFLPDGNGGFGERLLIPEASLSYLDDNVYEMVGLEVPDPEANSKGDLAFVDIRRIVANVPEDADEDDPPFQPLGKRVFLEFNYDERSADVVGTESGKTYTPDEDLEESELVVPESAQATHDNLATVTKCGPDADHVYPGQDVVAPAVTDSIKFQGEEHFFVQEPSQLIAIL